MARPPTVEVEGLKRLRAEMRRAEKDLKDLRRVHLDAAKTVSRAAKPAAPRRSGKLAASVRPGATQTMGVIRAGSASVPYANPIHWGWPARNIAAQPFLSETAQRTEPQWILVYGDELDRLVREMAGP